MLLLILHDAVALPSSGITNMYHSHEFTIVQMMHVRVHKTQKTFMDYIQLSSEEIADEINAIVAASKGDRYI